MGFMSSIMAVNPLLPQIVFVQPLRSRINHVDYWMFALAITDAVHGVVQTLLIQSPNDPK
jgi:hypothetical protein